MLSPVTNQLKYNFCDAYVSSSLADQSGLTSTTFTEVGASNTYVNDVNSVANSARKLGVTEGAQTTGNDFRLYTPSVTASVWSVNFWAKCSHSPGNFTGLFNAFQTTYNTRPLVYFGIQANVGGDLSLMLRGCNTSDVQCTALNTYPTYYWVNNVFNMITITFDGTNYKAYHNATDLGTMTPGTGYLVTDPVFSFGVATIINAVYRGTTASFCKMRIYKRVLSATEISNLYTNKI